MELFGILLPILIDLINKKVTDSDLRFWISVGVCSLFGIFFNFLDTGFYFFTPKLAFESITTSIMAVFGIAQLSYQGFWKGSTMRDNLKLTPEG